MRGRVGGEGGVSGPGGEGEFEESLEKWSGWGCCQWEEELGDRGEVERSTRCRRISVSGVAVLGERDEGCKVTLA